MPISVRSIINTLIEYIEKSDTTRQAYFVGIIPENHRTAKQKLSKSQLKRSYVSYPKTLLDDGIQYSDKSSWVYRPWVFSHFQLHVLLFEIECNKPTLYVFYHFELNSITHPIRHLRQEHVNPVWHQHKAIELIEDCGLRVLQFEASNV